MQPIIIRQHLDKVAQNSGLRSSNIVYSYLRSAFSWLWKNDYIDKHPMERMQKPNPQGEKSKFRVLTDTELTIVLENTKSMGYPFGNFSKVLALTGQRLTETSLMEWSELDFITNLWTIPASKTKNSKHIVTLSKQVIELIESAPERTGFVFSTTDGQKAIQNVAQ